MRRWAMLALVTTAFALGALTALAVAPLGPFLLESLRLSRAQVGLFLPATYLGGVLMALPAGWLVDRLGVRRTLALGQAFTGCMVALAGASDSMPVMLLCLLLGGFGFSVMNPATSKAVVEWFPPRTRGVAMGIKQTGLTLGGVVGSLVLPPLAVRAGWGDALGVAGVASVVAAVVVALAYRSPVVARGRLPTEWPRFVEVTDFLRRPGLLVVFGCGFALSVAQASLLAYLVLFARDTYSVSAVAAGQVLALAQAGGTAGRLAWGFISDRVFAGRRRPGVIITALIGATTYLVFALGHLVPASLALPLAFLAGAGAFGWVGLYFALVAEIGGPRYAGILTGVAVAFSWSGVLVGPLAFGLVLDAADSYAVPWLVLVVVAVGAAFALSRLQPLVRRDVPQVET
jgi:MFS family permease